MYYNYSTKQKYYKMETRNISLTLEEAKEWYNSNIILRDVALKAFTKEELEATSFRDIKTFQDACEALRLNYGSMLSIINQVKSVSKASAAMFELNIIRKALNLGQDLNLIKDPKNSSIYYPSNSFITEDSIYFKDEINSGKMEIIGKIKSEGVLYNVLGGYVNSSGFTGLCNFDFGFGVGFAVPNFSFLGCATKEIAQHFGIYFGMLITEAKYGDLSDFEIIENN